METRRFGRTGHLSTVAIFGAVAFLKLNQEQDVTFLFSSHDSMVLERARRVIRLRDGRIQSDERKNG